MCKFCKMKLDNEDIGEYINGNKTIGKIKDGSQVFEAYLNRYIVEDENIHRAAIVLDYGISNQFGGINTIKEKYIEIKYCPFCGEEL